MNAARPSADAVPQRAPEWRPPAPEIPMTPILPPAARLSCLVAAGLVAVAALAWLTEEIALAVRPPLPASSRIAHDRR